jgi:DMSO reductase family type II enzyme chaperone
MTTGGQGERAVVGLLARAHLHQWLARGFAYPGSQLQAAIGDGGFGAEMVAALSDSPLSSALAETIERHRQALTMRSEDVGSLEGEYTRLFGRMVLCPLNETSYGAHKTFQQVNTLSELASFYAAFGFKLSEKTKELPDHICVELEFLSALCAKEAHALARGWGERAEVCQEARKKFLCEHLATWFPALAGRVREHARLPFYPALVALAEVALALETAYVEATAQAREVHGG